VDKQGVVASGQGVVASEQGHGICVFGGKLPVAVAAAIDDDMAMISYVAVKGAIRANIQ